MEARFVYVTCKSADEARRVGRAVVEARLAACANILPAIESLYWWQGELVSDNECIVVFKTLAAHMTALIDKIREVHSYTVPCVIALPILEGNEDYLNWVSAECVSVGAD